MQPQTPAYPLPPQPSRKYQVASIILAVALVVALIFAIWAFQGRQDYKNKSEQKVAVAVVAAQKAQQSKDQAANDALNKLPYSAYTSPAGNGLISFSYPKTWSAYVDTTGSDEPINGYFYPGTVPGVSGTTPFALRLGLVSTSYSDVLSNFSSQISDGTVTVAAYIPPKMKGVANVQVGTRLDGAISQNSSVKGAMVVLKIRDKTLQISTQSPDFLADFNNIVLPSLTFAP